jgi:adenylosuccinate lyase
VYEIAMKTFQEGGLFKELLLKDPRVSKYITGEELDVLLNPQAYKEYSRQCAERIVRKAGGDRAATAC